MKKTLQEKLQKYNEPQKFMEQDIYPYYQPVESGQDTTVTIRDKRILMFGSNSYLGLTNHPELKEAAIRAIQKYGTGSSGSRLMNGNLDLHNRLENELAAFVNKPAATVFSTGFQTNIGTISCLTGRNDYILIDDKNHASIIEGCRLSFAKTYKFKHNDMQSLEDSLKHTNKDNVVLIIVDGIFSMEGDIAKLDEICQLADKYSASVLVDDAHSLGVIGTNGAGTASHFGVEKQTDFILGTFSKSLASLGGFVAGSAEAINYIKHNARSLLFSASIPPASAATVLKALEIIKREPERIDRLWDNTNYAKSCLQQAGFNIGQSQSPILPIFIGDEIDTFKITSYLLKNGLYVNPAIHPAVEKEHAILRFSLMATHTKQQIEQAVEILKKGRQAILETAKATINTL